MQLQDQNILFFTRTMDLGGTENVIIQLCEIFQPLVNKIVVCSRGGVNEEKLREMGIKHYQIPDIEDKTFKNLTSVSNTTSSLTITSWILNWSLCQMFNLNKDVYQIWSV